MAKREPNPNNAEKTAREIISFTHRSDVPDFITNAVLIAIEGAAITHNLPRPYMDEKETSETAIPKVAAILKAAGKMFSHRCSQPLAWLRFNSLDDSQHRQNGYRAILSGFAGF
jgi:hypothetical protein